MAHAGGLGMAPLVAIGGAMHMLTRPHIANDQPFWKMMPDWGWAMTSFLLWSGLSYLWSPYEDPKALTNAMVLILSVALFFPFLGAFGRAVQYSQKSLINLSIGAVLVLCVSLFADLISGYGLTFWVDPLGAGEDMQRKLADADMNTGHGIVVLVLMMPAILTLFVKHWRYGWLYAGACVCWVSYIAFLGNLASAQFALLVGVPTFIMACFYPYFMLKIAIFVGIASLIFAPFIGVWASLLGAEHKMLLPLSWEHRVEAWDYIYQKIMEKPVWGHGFDASRTFNETFILRGSYELPIVSLHPHNAGLHIWVETGMVGALLASLFIFLAGRIAIRRLSDNPLTVAMVTSYIAIAVCLCTVSFGVWQYWWWATLIFTGALLQIKILGYK